MTITNDITNQAVAVAPEPASGHCASCGLPTSDGITQPSVGLLCEQCAELRHDAYLDWYDSR